MASLYVKPLSEILARYKRIQRHIGGMIRTLNGGIQSEKEMIDNGNDLSETQGAMNDLMTALDDLNTQAQNMLVDIATLHEYQVRMQIRCPLEVYQYNLDADGASPGATFTAKQQDTSTTVTDAFEGLAVNDEVEVTGLTTDGNDGIYTVASAAAGVLTFTANLPTVTDETITAATHPNFKIEMIYDDTVPV